MTGITLNIVKFLQELRPEHKFYYRKMKDGKYKVFERFWVSSSRMYEVAEFDDEYKAKNLVEVLKKKDA